MAYKKGSGGMRGSLPPDAAVLALDAGGTSIKCALVTGDFAAQGTFEVAVQSDGGAEEIASAFRRVASMGRALAGGRQLLAVGVSTPGPFDYRAGASLMQHKYASVQNQPMRPWLSEAAVAERIVFCHDSSAYLAGEMRMRGWPEARVCGATIGTGLGFAMMWDGCVQEDPQGGPLRSIYRTPYGGETVEEFVSKRGILRAYRTHGGAGEGLTVKEIARRAMLGEARARMAFRDAAHALAEVAAPVIRAHALERLTLGGQIAKAGALLVEPLKERLRALSVPCEVSATYADEMPLIGAAVRAWEVAGR